MLIGHKMNDVLFGTPTRAAVARRVCSTPIRLKGSTPCPESVNQDVDSFLFELDEAVQECDTVLGSSCTVGRDSTVEAVQVEDKSPQALDLSAIDHPQYDQHSENVQTHKSIGTRQVQSRQGQHADQSRSILQVFDGFEEGDTPDHPCNVHASLCQHEPLDSDNGSDTLLESCTALEGLLSNINSALPSSELQRSSDNRRFHGSCSTPKVVPQTDCEPVPLIELDDSCDSNDSITELQQLPGPSHSNKKLPRADLPSSCCRTDIITVSSPCQHVYHTGSSPVFFTDIVESFHDFEDCWPADVVIIDSDSDASVVIDQCHGPLPSTLPPPAPEEETSEPSPSTPVFEKQAANDDLSPTQSTTIGSCECTPKVTHMGKDSPAISVKSDDVLHIDADEDTIAVVAGLGQLPRFLEHESTIIPAKPPCRQCTHDIYTVPIGIDLQKQLISGRDVIDRITHVLVEEMHNPEGVSASPNVDHGSIPLSSEVTNKASCSNQWQRRNAPPLLKDTNPKNVDSCERTSSSKTTIASYSNGILCRVTVQGKDNLAFASDVHQDPLPDGVIVSNITMSQSDCFTNTCLFNGEVVNEIADEVSLPSEGASKDCAVHRIGSLFQRSSPKKESDNKSPERDLRQRINDIRSSCTAFSHNVCSTKPKAQVMYTVSHEQSLLSVSSRRGSVHSRLDVPKVGKTEMPGSSNAPTTKSREPFMSEDPEENDDNANPNWEALRRLTTDEERYEAIRKVWHNARIPDPHCELTTFHYRKRFLCPKNMKSTTALKQQKRKRTETSDNHEQPVKKQRLDTDIFDLKLKELERKRLRDFTAAQINLERELSKLPWNASQSMTPWMNGGPHYHHRAHTAPWDMRYFQQKEQRLHSRYDTDTRDIYNKYSARAHRLLSARDEVHRFNQFYVGLGDGDPRVLTEQQMREQLNIEKLLGEFRRHYKDTKN